MKKDEPVRLEDKTKKYLGLGATPQQQQTTIGGSETTTPKI